MRGATSTGLVLLVAAGAVAQAPSLTPLAVVVGGSYPSFLSRSDAPPVSVARFALDEHAVTNAQYLAFVRAQPTWRRAVVARLFAEETYLSHWAGDLDLGGADPAAPVTFVSWHAARAYCESIDRRLPTEAEWEWAARADATRADATADPAFVAAILAGYGRLGDAPGAADSGERSVWGVRGLFGLVWEWVEDYGAALVSADDRERTLRGETAVCGAGAISGGDTADYATFMRFALRSSLRADFALGTLGFRCAADLRSTEAP